MKEKKGFTLIELLATIVIIGTITLIAVPVVTGLVNQSRKQTFKESVLSIVRTYEYKEIDESLELGDIDVNDLDLNVTNYNGVIKRDENSAIFVSKVTNGIYCADGTSEELNVYEGDCSNIDYTSPEIVNFVVTKTTNSLQAIVSFQEPDTVIQSYEFRLLDANDNVVYDWTVGDTLSGTETDKVTTKTYNNLTQGAIYKVYVRITNNSVNGNDETIDYRQVKLTDIKKPVISYDMSKYELSKDVTITFDSDVENSYKIINKEKEIITDWTVVEDETIVINIDKYDYTILAKSTDSVNVLSASSQIGYIDYTKPEVTVSDISETWATSDTIKLNMTDNLSGVTNWCITNLNNTDNCNWNNVSVSINKTLEHVIALNGTYYAYVKDSVGNISDAYRFVIDKVDAGNPNVPTITASDSISSDSWHTKAFTLTFSNSTSVSEIKYFSGLDKDNLDVLSSTVTFDSSTTGTVYYVKACNEVGTCSDLVSYIVKLETETPTAPVLKGGSSTYATSRTIDINVNSSATSDIDYYEYYVSTSNKSQTGGSWTRGNSVTLNESGTYYVYMRAISKAGKVGNISDYQIVKIDADVPTVPKITASDSKASDTWHTKTFTLTFSGSTSTSDITYYYGLDSSSMGTKESSVTLNSSVAKVTYYVKACNEAGTCSDSIGTNGIATYVAKLEIEKPSAPELTGGSSEYATTRTISVSKSSNSTSGLNYYEYYVSTSSSSQTGGSWTKGNSVTLNTNGTYYVFMRATSNAGKVSNVSASQVVKIDTNKPTISLKSSGSATITVEDSNDILATYFTYAKNGNADIKTVSCVDTSDLNKTVTNTNTLSVGTHNIKCTVTKTTGTSANATKEIIVEEKYTGVPEKTYNVGDTINYGGIDFLVVSDNGDSVTLITKSNVTTSAFGSTNAWSSSTIKNYLNNTWLKNNEIMLYDSQKGGIVYDSETGSYVRLIRKGELSTSLPNASKTAFWTMTTSGSNVYYALSNGTTTYTKYSASANSEGTCYTGTNLELSAITNKYTANTVSQESANTIASPTATTGVISTSYKASTSGTCSASYTTTKEDYTYDCNCKMVDTDCTNYSCPEYIPYTENVPTTVIAGSSCTLYGPIIIYEPQYGNYCAGYKYGVTSNCTTSTPYSTSTYCASNATSYWCGGYSTWSNCTGHITYSSCKGYACAGNACSYSTCSKSTCTGSTCTGSTCTGSTCTGYTSNCTYTASNCMGWLDKCAGSGCTSTAQGCNRYNYGCDGYKTTCAGSGCTATTSYCNRYNYNCAGYKTTCAGSGCTATGSYCNGYKYGCAGSGCTATATGCNRYNYGCAGSGVTSSTVVCVSMDNRGNCYKSSTIKYSGCTKSNSTCVSYTSYCAGSGCTKSNSTCTTYAKTCAGSGCTAYGSYCTASNSTCASYASACAGSGCTAYGSYCTASNSTCISYTSYCAGSGCTAYSQVCDAGYNYYCGGYGAAYCKGSACAGYACAGYACAGQACAGNACALYTCTGSTCIGYDKWSNCEGYNTSSSCTTTKSSVYCAQNGYNVYERCAGYETLTTDSTCTSTGTSIVKPGSVVTGTNCEGYTTSYKATYYVTTKTSTIDKTCTTCASKKEVCETCEGQRDKYTASGSTVNWARYVVSEETSTLGVRAVITVMKNN